MLSRFISRNGLFRFFHFFPPLPNTLVIQKMSPYRFQGSRFQSLLNGVPDFYYNIMNVEFYNGVVHQMKRSEILMLNEFYTRLLQRTRACNVNALFYFNNGNSFHIKAELYIRFIKDLNKELPNNSRR